MTLADYTADELVEFFDFLDELRESGETNMFGARPYLIDEFDMEPDLAGKVLTSWMNTFSHEDLPLRRAIKALATARGETESPAT